MPDTIVDPAELRLGRRALQELCPEPVALPLVSIILHSWNGAEIVGPTILSIRTQTYPRIEAIIVDNGSTDDSRAAIAHHTAGDPRFRTLHLASNRGPLGGVLAGLDLAGGHFVVLLDSDQTLLPEFVSWHVQAHLAVRRNVAFTSSPVAEPEESGAPLGAGRETPDDDWGPEALPLRRAETVPRLATLREPDYAQLSQVTRSLPPTMPDWPNSAQSANMYRRFMLDMLRPSADPETMMRLSADGHFSRLAHLFGGSAVILRPLSAHRIHGREHFSATPGDAGARRVETLRVLLRDIPKTVARIGPGRFWRVFRAVLTADDAVAGRGARDPAIQAMVAEYLPQLVLQFGARPAIQMVGRLFGARHLRRIVAAAHHGAPPLRIRQLVFIEVLRRLSKRALRRTRRRIPVPAA